MTISRFTIRRFAALAAPLLALLALPLPVAAQAVDDASPRIAVIDVGRILEESTAGQRLIADIKALAEQKGAEGQPMAEKAKSLQQQIEAGALSLSQEKLADLRKQFQDATKALKRFEDDANEEIDTLRTQRIGEIEKGVMAVVNQVGNEFGYTMMFNKFQSGLIFAQDEIDITDLILERYNAATAAASAQGN